MKPAPGYESDPNIVWKLKKSLYGLKQAGRTWYIKLAAHLQRCGYTQSRADPCLFFSTTTHGTVYISVYVDDICFFGDNLAINHAVSAIQQTFKIRDLGQLSYCLGIQISHTSTGILIHQSKYIQDILTRFQSSIPHHKFTPLLANCRIAPTLPSDHPNYDSAADAPIPTSQYAEALGCLNYAAVNTRPDISTAVSYLSSFCHNPSVKHWDHLMRVYAYLQHTPDLGIFYSNTGNADPIGYADAAFNVHDQGRSQLGFLIMLANGPIAWRSCKTGTTALSSTEAEYMAISELGRELQAFTNLYIAINRRLSRPIQIFEDNLGVLAMCISDIYTNRSKHIDLRHHYIRELVTNGIVTIAHVRSREQLADLLTKGLGKNIFNELRAKFGLRSATSLAPPPN